MIGISQQLVLHPDTSAALKNYVRSPVHAVLLEGHEGLGKSLVARQLAAEILETDPGKLDQYPYLRTLTIEKQAIPIEQVRALNSFFGLKVPGSKAIKRAVIIPDADYMTLPAQNALLKLLEEPPADTIFVLTSSAAHKLLPTILSRLQKIQIHVPSQTDIMAHFSHTYETSTVEQAKLLAGDSIAQLSNMLSGEDTAQSLLPVVKQVLGASTFDRLTILAEIAKDKAAALQFVDTLAEVAAASLQSGLQRGAEAAHRWHQTESAAYEAAAALRKNANAKLVMTELALSL